jgi:hypothetical protein
MSQSTIYRNALPGDTMLFEYRLESVLGAGAFGMTYLARDTHLEKPVAIKEYLPTELAMRALDGSVVPVATDHQCDYQWGLDRFLLEARTLARFVHPNIVRVNRYFEANGTGYMVMDYEEGVSLARLLAGEPPLDEARLRALVMPLLDGLEAVHEAGFLHRDIKPANVFVRGNGAPVLLDFGAARAAVGGTTRSLTAVLTPGYAPLEQYSSDGRQGPWSDIYALAGVAYRVLVNENPPDAIARMRHDVVPERLRGARGRACEALLKSVQWALDPDGTRRPQSVREWRLAILGQAPAGSAADFEPASRRALGAPASATVPTVPAASLAAAPGSPRRPLKAENAGPRPVWRWGAIAFAIVAAVAWVGGRLSHPPREKTAALHAAQEDVSAPERPPRERIDRPGPGTPEPEQLRRQAAEELRRADTDGDGFLSREEARRFPFLSRDFDRVDADGDGRISIQELLRLRKLQAQRRPQERDPARP